MRRAKRSPPAHRADAPSRGRAQLSQSARMRRGWRTLLGAAALLAAACSPLPDVATPPAGLSSEWRDLLGELRAFERTLGFRETDNFARVSLERQAYDYCGWTSKHALPYSYEDPAIRWLEPADLERCREAGPDNDWDFGSVEVWGEIGTPITPAMIAADLDRFVYLVIHEDCHDQFQLPYGIEEPLCNVLTYRAMAQFAAQKYAWFSRENRSLRHYGLMQRRQTRATVVNYRELERLYARYRRGELTLEALLAARASLFGRLERALEMGSGEMNNIGLARHMTYSRHYDYLEGVVRRLGPDLARVVGFFREVDAAMPTPEALLQRLGIRSRTSVEFVRAYEQAAIEAIEHALGAPRTLARD